MQKKISIRRTSRGNHLKEEKKLIDRFPDVSQTKRLESSTIKNRSLKKHGFSDISEKNRSTATKLNTYSEQLALKYNNRMDAEVRGRRHSSIRLKVVFVILATLVFSVVMIIGLLEYTIL